MGTPKMREWSTAVRLREKPDVRDGDLAIDIPCIDI